jgi:ParB/RepB/Spo0J family partition protein
MGQENEATNRTDQKLEEMIQRYLADPESLSLEERLEVYQYSLEQVAASQMIGDEAGILKEKINTFKEELERARKEDPAFIITPKGTFYKREPEMKMAPIDRVMPNPDLPELFLDMEGEEFELLKRSIQETGIIQPITVDQEMQVICGDQRLRAARALGLTTVPVLIRWVRDKETRAILSIEENIRRRQLQPSEMARAIKKLIELKETKNRADQVAREIGLSKRQVNRYRGLENLIPEVSVLLDGGRLTQEVASQIAQLDEEIQRTLYESLGERIAQSLNEQKSIEFKKVNADLLQRIESLSTEIKKYEQRVETLNKENRGLQDHLDRAEFKVGDELRAKAQLEEELQKARSEMYQKIQEKQALIDKLAKNVEPKIVPPPDYLVLKAENEKLKTALTESARPPEMIFAEIHEVIAIRLLPINLTTLKGRLSPEMSDQLKSIISKLEVWIGLLKEIIHESSRGKKR